MTDEETILELSELFKSEISKTRRSNEYKFNKYKFTRITLYPLGILIDGYTVHQKEIMNILYKSNNIILLDRPVIDQSSFSVYFNLISNISNVKI